MIFRQLFEPASCSYTYLLACQDTGIAVLIDPVLDTVERDLEVIRDLGVNLGYALETHIHADHLTGGLKLKALTECKIAGPALDNLPCRDLSIREAEPFRVGHIDLHPLFTPGHTDTHHAYLFDNGTQLMLFSGDALLIESCGRTDFQSGDPYALYKSVHEKFFTLTDETLVYPAHDYEQRAVSTIGQEKLRNPRLGKNQLQDQFVEIMNNLKLPYPRKIEFAVPGNEQCGKCPDTVPEEMLKACEMHDQG